MIVIGEFYIMSILARSFYFLKRSLLFVKRNNQYSMVCNARVAEDCSENSEWCDSEEEAQEWVEEECWIFSGEGWFCNECNSHFMRNLSQTRRDKGLDSLLPDGWDDDLEVGINTVR